MILFASDLDNTIIHSYKIAEPGDVCVETKDGKELSFISPAAYVLLRKISEKCWFVPVTTRTVEQYRRIELGVSPQYAIVSHGAQIIKNGVVDETWTDEVSSSLGVELPVIKESDLLYDVRYAGNFFIFMKSESPLKAAQHLREITDAKHFEVSAVHNKVYVIPRGLNKGETVKKLKKLIGVDYTICAGDSKLDLSMLSIADRAIFPDCLELPGLTSVGAGGRGFAESVLLAVKAELESRS